MAGRRDKPERLKDVEKLLMQLCFALLGVLAKLLLVVDVEVVLHEV